MRKVKGIIHWLSLDHAQSAEVRLYDRLVSVPDPLADKERDFKEFLNPNSMEILSDSYVEPGLGDAEPGSRYQFERLGYFCKDEGIALERPIFNRTVALRDSWAKVSG